MKKIITIVTSIVLTMAAYSQAPTKFNYQAVARDAAGMVLSNKTVSTQISILKTTATGQDVYVETHAVTTNKFGLFNFQIGDGIVVSGNISSIDWSSDSYFVKVEFDGDGGSNYTVLSTTQLISVPYSLFANNVLNDKVDDADADPSNELQSLSIKGDTVYLSNGGFVKLPAFSGFDGKYSSLTGAPTNLSNFNNDAGYLITEKDSSVTNELQNLNFNNDTLFLSDGGKVYLGAYANALNNDNDSTNELQVLSFSNDTLFLTNGGKVYFGNYNNLTNNDNDSTNELQVVSFSNDTLFLSDGGKVYLGAYTNVSNNDNDSTNEIQLISFSNDTLHLSNGGKVFLGAYTNQKNNDNDSTNEIQAVSFSNDTLFLTNGGKVFLGAYANASNDDNDSTNEIQALSISNDTLKLSNGGFVILPKGFDGKYSSLTGAPSNVSSFTNDAGYLKNEKDSSNTNELQFISLSNDTIYLSNGGFAVLPTGFNGKYTSLSGAPTNVSSFINDVGYLTTEKDSSNTNELQVISLSNDTIHLSNGGFAVLPAGFDGKYASLTGAPSNVSSFSNDAGYLKSEKDSSNTNELQVISLSNDTIRLSNGGYIALPSGFDGKYASLTGAPSNVSSFTNDAGYLKSEKDSSNTNELQVISLSNDTIRLSNGGYIVLPTGFDGKYSSLAGSPSNVSSFTNDAGYLKSEKDSSTTNEIQALSLRNDTLFLSNGGYVYLGAYASGSNNDNDSTNEIQTLSIKNDTLSLTGGGSVVLPGSNFDGKYSSLTGAPTGLGSFTNNVGYLTSEKDSSTTNEIQSLSMSNDTLYLTNGGKVYLGGLAGGSSAANNDNDSTNEIQLLSLSNDTIYLSNGGSIVLPEQLPDGNAAGNTLYWDGTKWVASSNIHNNGGHVGIGNNNPKAKLQLGNDTASGALDNFSEFQLILFEGSSASKSQGLGSRPNTLVNNTDSMMDIDVNGVTSWRFHDKRLEPMNSGRSVFIGPSSGVADDKSDNRNVGIGWNSLLMSTTGSANIAVGARASENNTTGSNNVAMGYRANATNTIGRDNVALGFYASLNNRASGITSVGFEALKTNTTGTGLTAVGYRSLDANTTGNFNTAVGSSSLGANTTGAYNTAMGYGTAQHNTTGSFNTAFGHYALVGNSTGAHLTAVGYRALYGNSTGLYNTAVGNYALEQNTTGRYNTALGYRAGLYNKTGGNNTAIGSFANERNTGIDNTSVGFRARAYGTSGRYNTSIGSYAHERMSTGSQNTALGYRAGALTSSGLYNVAVGDYALTSHTTRRYSTAVGSYALTRSNADWNTAVGTRAAQATTTGYQNTAVGGNALYRNTTGRYNTAIGVSAGYSSVTTVENTNIGWNSGFRFVGNGNTNIGSQSGYATGTVNTTNNISIGYRSPARGSNYALIGNTSTRYVNSYGIFARISDGQFKKNVKENVPGIEFITGLRPVSYEYDMDKLNEFIYGTEDVDEEYNQLSREAKSGHVETGFIAQEVDALVKELNYDFDGVVRPQSDKDHYSISYSSFVVPLVKATQEQQEIIEKQQQEIDALKSLLKEIQLEIRSK